MRKNPTPQSGFVNPRNLFAVLLCSAGVMLAMISFAATPKSLKSDRPTTDATPSSGTLSLGTPTLTYTGGPFVVANVTAQANGAPICTAPMSCDDYTLTINVPVGTDNTKLVKVTVGWPVSAADFDVYILKGATVVATAASSSDPEVAFIPGGPGGWATGTNQVYTIRVVPFAPAGQSYTATVALEDAAIPPPPPPGIAPRYHNFAPNPSNLAGADSAGEPSTGVDWNPNVAALKHDSVNTGGVAFFTANLNEYRVSFDDCSSPAKNPNAPTGAFSNAPLWEDVTNPSEGAATVDPIGFVDHQTGRVFHSQLAGPTSVLSYSDDDGNTWTQSNGSGQPAGVDHQTVGGGPYNEGAVPPPPPHPTYANQVYYASQDIGTAFAARSDTGGLAFGAGVPMWNISQCGGLHGHIKVGPDGTVYVPNKGCGGGQGVAVSENNGITWTVRLVPGSTPGDTDPSVGIASDNTLYFGYQNGDGHPHVATSTDHGQTWIHDVDVGGGAIKNTVFPETVAGDGDANGPNTGRAAFGFLGTPTGGNYQDTNAFRGIWHFYIATTFDRGATWTLVKATGNDPVQIGSICTGGTTCGGDRNLLDFNDLQVDKEGRVVAAYADGCVGTCTEATSAAHAPPYNESRAALSSILRQSGGRRLFAAYDPPEPAAPLAPRVNSVTKTSGIVHLDWSEPDNSGSPLTGYRVYRRTDPGLYGAPLATITVGCPACKTTYDDPTTVTGTTYFYKVTALNDFDNNTIPDESPFCGEFAVGVGGGETPCIPPGLPILEDQQGDIITPIGESTNPGWDLRKLSIAEPYPLAPDKLVFTLKVESFAGGVPPANTRWPIQFLVNGGTTTGYWVDMTTFPADLPIGATFAFKYGTFNPTGGTGGVYGAPNTRVGNADPISNFNPDGTITIVVPRSAVGNPAVGGTLSGFLVRVRFGTDAGAVTPDNMPDSLAPGGNTYTVVGNDPFCRPNLAPIANLTGSPLTGEAPLTVNFDASTSFDPDTAAPADTIVSYTFDFGDGTAPVTQGSPLISHIYYSNGAYRATVSVTDSRGKPSDSVAGVNVEVEVPLAHIDSRKIHGPKGPFDITLFDGANPDNVPVIECRTGGATNAYTIVYTFDRTLNQGFAPTATRTQGTGTVDTANSGFGPLATQYTVALTGVTNRQHFIITLSGVHDSAGAILNNVPARLDLLIGDTNGNHVVNSLDISQTQAQSGKTVNNNPGTSNFRNDTVANGVINSLDISTVQSKSGTGLP